MIVKGITIHNTNNDKSAKENYEMLLKAQKVNLCHYLVDEEEVINTFPSNQEASHTGRGYDFGNKYTIAIEICRSQSKKDVYLKAEAKAVELIKQLMKEYKLETKDLYFHKDFNNTYCPHRILDIYKTKERFINGYFI